ncbi:hypothetical protein [Rhizobium panacihumi]|uniref:hypothetical protein n=1 Tax=Rhizobium panacihumi TaxID=2008450 RepID=UPI003D7B358B
MNFESSSRQKSRHKLASLFRISGEYAARDVLRLGSLTLVLVGSALLLTGALCRNTATLPEWTGIAPVTAGMVILIFLTGRHS